MLQKCFYLSFWVQIGSEIPEGENNLWAQPSKVEAQDAELAEEVIAVRVQHQTEVFLVK